jgi:endonuclease/exonuclease/phosphatase family metal-dependent hydrolase
MRQVIVFALLIAAGLGCKSAPREAAAEEEPVPVPAAAPALAAKATLRILSYNIHHGEGVDGKLDLPRIAEIIKRERPDLVALQEVDKKATRTDGVDQAAELARLTGMQHVYGAAMPHQGGEYGQAVLARARIVDRWVHFLPQQPGREPRIALGTRIEKPGVWFVSTHLDHQLEDVRVRQAKELERLYGSKEEPVILAGDFNARPTNATMQVFGRWLDSAGTNGAPTIPAANPAARIDYILLRPTNVWEVVESRVLDEAVASDHRPVLSVVRLRP